MKSSKNNGKVFHLIENNQPIMVTVKKPDDPTSEGTAKISSNLNAKMSNLSNQKKNLQSLDLSNQKPSCKEDLLDE